MMQSDEKGVRLEAEVDFTVALQHAISADQLIWRYLGTVLRFTVEGSVVIANLSAGT